VEAERQVEEAFTVPNILLDNCEGGEEG